MKKIIRTAGILTMVFAASVAVYFFAARKNMQKEEAVFSPIPFNFIKSSSEA